jgi:hypothetical protein
MASFSRGVLLVLLAPWLGHGRRVEFLLILGQTIYLCALILSPAATMDSQATRDLLFVGSEAVLIGALLLAVLSSSAGLGINIAGGRGSRALRFVGGFLAAMIWLWFAVKFCAVGAMATPGFAWSCAAVFAGFSTMGMAAAGRPVPGAPGAL